VLDERGSDDAAQVWDEASRPLASRLVYPEGRAALALARRLGRVKVGYRRTVREFEEVYDELEALDVADEIVRHAGWLAERYALRGYDAVHLASALEVLGDSDVLVTWDAELADAARVAGLSVIGSGGKS